ncbi:hypothetical protein EV426DRAFT_620857 [Tirmania nivea]|nr:hypothetical protein EV426DRAFT_620857 [Tirmania nivea]
MVFSVGCTSGTIISAVVVFVRSSIGCTGGGVGLCGGCSSGVVAASAALFRCLSSTRCRIAASAS